MFFGGLMEKIKKLKCMPNLIIVLLIIFTILICLFGIKNVIIKEFSKNIYINNNEYKMYISEEKVLEDIAKPESFDFVIPIFMYHFITDDFGDVNDPENFMSPLKLETHLKYISENGYETVYITELEKLYKYTKPVALTFDDCFVYFYNNAFPLLKKYNLKASIYVITDYIDGPNYLTTSQLNEMKESGIIDIQSHSLTHPYLTRVSLEQAKREIIDSKKALRDLFNVDSTVFCYPIGDFNSNVLNIVKENYKLALDMDGGIYNSTKHDVYKIPRIYANRSMHISTFVNYLKQSEVNINR
jgi:peptidoglycan/xylan/chitin deacetylase (PgdA/CDA1 family)